jgi:hypothetical protein
MSDEAQGGRREGEGTGAVDGGAKLLMLRPAPGAFEEERTAVHIETVRTEKSGDRRRWQI